MCNIRRPRHTRDASTARAGTFTVIKHYCYKFNCHVFLCGRTRRSAPTRRICYRLPSRRIRKWICHVKHHKHPRNAMRGGMMSGCAASRTGQLSGTKSQFAFGGYQGGHRPRWPVPPSQSTSLRAAIGDGRPTSPDSVTA